MDIQFEVDIETILQDPFTAAFEGGVQVEALPGGGNGIAWLVGGKNVRTFKGVVHAGDESQGTADLHSVSFGAGEGGVEVGARPVHVPAGGVFNVDGYCTVGTREGATVEEYIISQRRKAAIGWAAAGEGPVVGVVPVAVVANPEEGFVGAIVECPAAVVTQVDSVIGGEGAAAGGGDGAQGGVVGCDRAGSREDGGVGGCGAAQVYRSLAISVGDEVAEGEGFAALEAVLLAAVQLKLIDGEAPF